ncbi:E3 ubiquitin-protein ligase [Drechslerella dactyloides]|uniref:E3 ubiquitin-protein ligase n=1 Tax=Drechslerella dactyloides TaxID=74499 RepID=A0AAD6NLT4_DREDA|nr:E3 ubiquitin-protein ligase [Drechslerella dactyloides]
MSEIADNSRSPSSDPVEELIEKLDKSMAEITTSDNTPSASSTHCCICLDTTTDSFETISCGHMFHEGCIQVWRSWAGACPTCRHPTQTDSPQEADTIEEPEEWAEFEFIIRNSGLPVDMGWVHEEVVP